MNFKEHQNRSATSLLSKNSRNRIHSNISLCDCVWMPSTRWLSVGHCKDLLHRSIAWIHRLVINEMHISCETWTSIILPSWTFWCSQGTPVLNEKCVVLLSLKTLPLFSTYYAVPTIQCIFLQRKDKTYKGTQFGLFKRGWLGRSFVWKHHKACSGSSPSALSIHYIFEIRTTTNFSKLIVQKLLLIQLWPLSHVYLLLPCETHTLS